MKKILLTVVLTAASFVLFAQEKKKIELAFVDYTESDSAFFNTDVPESHHSYDNFELYYHFEGDSTWVKVKKNKQLKLVLSNNEKSAKQIKKYKRKKFYGKALIIGGFTGGAALGVLLSPVGGLVVIIGSGGTGYYIVAKADKHLFEAIHLYNQSLTN